MNVTVNSQSLAVELRLLNKVVQGKPTIPILGYILLEAREGSLYFAATDHEVFLSTSCAATTTTPGKLVLPAAKLLMMCERFADDDVNISVVGGVAVVRSGTFTSRLQTLDHDDFPLLPDASGTTIEFSGSTLPELIAKTRCAVIESNQKYILRGVLLSVLQTGVVMVSTDTKRLAVAAGTGCTGPDAQTIIPTKALDVLAPIDATHVTLTIGEKHLFFAIQDNGIERMLISRTIDGEFPKYERIIPRGNDKIVTIERTALAAALRRVGTVSEESRAVNVALVSGAVEISSSSVEVGFADERVVASYDGPELKISVNGSYMLDFLEAATNQMIKMLLKDSITPMLLMDGESYLTVIMPIKR